MISVMLLAVLGAEPTLESGVYGELMLARDPDTKVISGFFNSSTGAGQFTCVFYFESKADKLDSWYPADPKARIAGSLTVTRTDAFQLTLKEEHGGCWNVQHFADAKDPASFTIDTARPWKAIKVVKEKKAKFFGDASAAKPKKAYLVTGDAVGVLEKKGEWLSVEFVGGGKTTTGWMPASAFF